VELCQDALADQASRPFFKGNIAESVLMNSPPANPAGWQQSSTLRIALELLMQPVHGFFKNPMRLLMLAVALVLCGGASTLLLAQQPASDNKFVGEQACATCHAAQASKFATNPHHKLAAMHDGKGPTCEACHGAGKDHVLSNGDKNKIFAPAEASTSELNARCLSCHQKSHPDFLHSAHGEAKLSCISCHSIHQAKSSEHLLKADQPALCQQCHSKTQDAFAQPFHHPVPEGKLQCSSCHNPHAIPGETMPRSVAALDATCAKCHADKAAPFKFEHPVVKGEGCTTCHAAHGSSNAHLLKQSNMNSLCQQCHSVAPTHPHAANATASGPTAATASCTSCHSQVHGSNLDPHFLK